jgi:hypothetical protein
MATLPLSTPSITGGALTINLAGEGDSTHVVSLDQDIDPASIDFTNPPSTGYTRVRIIFKQATPAGTTYDVPINAWAGTYNGSAAYSLTWDSDYHVYQDTTPTIVDLVSWDQMATIRARANAPAGQIVEAVTALPAEPEVDHIYVIYPAA